jgi:prevent-host-death family protein
MADHNFKWLIMQDVPVFEAKTRLSELLARAQQGETVTITRHGKPMARLVAAEPVAPYGSGVGDESRESQEVATAFEELARLRVGLRLGSPVREAIEAGRD